MKPSEYPQSKTADIALILEGTYPFLSGGVANWVSELIRFFPQYTFAVIFLGTKAEDYQDFYYPLHDNVVHFEAHYLFEPSQTLHHSAKEIEPETLQKIEKLHQNFSTFDPRHCETMNELFELIHDKQITENLFARSHSSWEFIRKKYDENYSEQSFFDYFWGVKNLHQAIWKLSKVVEGIPKVNILHSASTGYAGLLGALIQRKYQIPYVLTEHGIYTKERWIELMRNYFFDYIIKEQHQFSNERGLLEVWMKFFSIFGKIAYNAADPIISLFEGYRKRQIADGAAPERTRIISYGVDCNVYQFLGKEKPNLKNPIIACLGRVVPIKDTKTFIRSSALLIQKMPEAEAWIVGSTTEDPEYFATCENLISMMGLEHKIKFLGEQQVMDIYPKIDLLILTSISEGSPFVILESLSVGVPVVTTDVGGCSELINGKNPEDIALGVAGKLANIADPYAIATAAFELLSDESAWIAAQKVGAARIRKYYSMERLVENYSHIYEEALINGRNRV